MTDSIYDLKKSFIESQVRLLTPPNTTSHTPGSLRPPRNWQDAAPVTAEGDLPGKVVEMVLLKLNLTARKHNRLIYSTQAIRHVAEQIDALYREASESVDSRRRAPTATNGDHDLLRRGVDLTDPATISTLPEEYPLRPGVDSDEDLERYQQLRSQLLTLANSVKSQQQRCLYYENLKGLLGPFRAPGRTVQPNLVTRGGALDTELERMRAAALRLSVTIERARGLVRGAEEVERERERELELEGQGVGIAGRDLVEVLAGLERRGE